MKGYKGFNKELKCGDFQYEIGKKYETGKSELCHSGFHFCENPLDTLSYYQPNNNRYTEIEAENVSDKTDKDSKRCSKNIKIGAELDIKGLIKAGVSFIFNETQSPTTGSFAHSATTGSFAHSATTGSFAHSATTGSSAHSATTGSFAHSATTGDFAHSATTGSSAHSATTGSFAHSATTGSSAHSATTGYSAHSATTGYSAHSATTGDSAHSATTGDSAHSATTGSFAHSATTGYSAHSATTGDSAHSATTGYSAHSATTGSFAHSATTGSSAISAALGRGSAAKGIKDSWLVLTEWKYKKGKWIIKEVKTVKVDGKIIKENTWYKLEKGEFKEYKDSEIVVS